MKTFDEVWAQVQFPGHLEIDDGKLLWASAKVIKKEFPTLGFLEIGSFQGKSTVLLAHHAHVTAIEPSWLWNDHSNGNFDGLSEAGFVYKKREVDEASRRALHEHVKGLPVMIIAQSSTEAYLAGIPFSLIFFDGDHTIVDGDFDRFEPNLVKGGFACFHDYAPDYPVVQVTVNKLIYKKWTVIRSAGSLIVLEKP